MKPHVRDKNYMESANCSELLSAGTDMHYFYSGGEGGKKIEKIQRKKLHMYKYKNMK